MKGRGYQEPRTEEREIFDRALAALAALTGLEFEAEALPKGEGNPGDAYIRIPGRKPGRITVEVKKYLTEATLAPIIHQVAGRRPLLVAEYVNPRMADRLRQFQIPFIDTAGNAYLKFPPLFVFVRGLKPERTTGRVERLRPFQTAGLKIIFGFLCQPDLANETYRQIAATTGVALGTVAVVMDDLQKLAFLQDRGKDRRLIRRAELLRRWVTAYPEQLRPKLMIGEFETDEIAAWKTTKLAEGYWGGEVAAAKLTHYLHPEMITIYVRDKREAANIQLKLKLKKTDKGNVELLRAFWDPQLTPPEPNVAPVLLTYADLVASAEPRNIETARILYEQQIDRLVRED